MRMARTNRMLAAALALGLAACADEPTAPARTEAAPRPAAAAREKTIPDRYVVVFTRGTADAPGLARRLAAAHGGKVHHTYEHALQGFAATLPPAAVEALRKNPNVAYVEADRMTTTAQASQPSAPWGLDRVDQRDAPPGGSYLYARTGSGVNAYVIDSGIYTAHPEFGGRARVGYDATGGTGQDCTGHGTHVAGIIGGSTYGVAKGVSLVAVRVYGCSPEAPWSTVIAGIDWVRYSHVKPAVVNMSLTGGTLQAADDAVKSLIAAGVTVVASAGNDAYDACFYSPARIPEVLTVGASNAQDQQAWFSNGGDCLDLYAPGEAITSAWLYGGTNTVDGSSQAAPHATGAAALYLEANTPASPAWVHWVVVNNTTVGRLSSLGDGSRNLLLYTAPVAALNYRRIRNRWQSSQHINLESGPPASSTVGWGAWSAHWRLEAVPGTPYYFVRNRWTNGYLHAEYGSLQAGAIQTYWHSAMWELEPVDGHHRIKNRFTGTYLHVEYGSLQLGSILTGWHSAQWTIEDTGEAAGQ